MFNPFGGMEWSKDKTLKLIELLQVNANLWNTSVSDTRRDKQKRKEELRRISLAFGISVSDTTKKIQHLRTQYNREAAREVRANSEGPNDRYISNWYAYEYLHFMKVSNKPYRVLQFDKHLESNSNPKTNTEGSDYKVDNLSPPPENPSSELLHSFKPEIIYPNPINRDEFSIFGEYIANELRMLKDEKNLLIAKKKIQDVIFEMRMGMISEPTVFTPSTQTQSTTLHNGKIYTTPVMSTISTMEPLTTAHTPTTTGISEIIINGACHYSSFKVDDQ